MKERSQLIEWIRGEVLGPSRPVGEAAVAEFRSNVFSDPVGRRTGPLVWRPSADQECQEVLYYAGETPQRKYGAGMLHPEAVRDAAGNDQVALHHADRLGINPEDDGLEQLQDDVLSHAEEDEAASDESNQAGSGVDDGDDFDVTSPDVRYPSTIGLSCCVCFDEGGRLRIRLPHARRFAWQSEGSAPIQLNGRYQAGLRQYNDENGHAKQTTIWRRSPATAANAVVLVERAELVHGKVVTKAVPMQQVAGIALNVQVFPRRLCSDGSRWLLTIVLRNATRVGSESSEAECVLYQSFFEVEVEGGCIEKYPESERPFGDLDEDEQSLALLYRESATWGVGHGCAAGWDAEPGGRPATVYADVMPAVQLPSMTPDIELDGKPVRLSMRDLAELPESGEGPAWQAIEGLSSAYSGWIHSRREEVGSLSPQLAAVATRHLKACEVCLKRIDAGIALLKSDPAVRRAFRLANLAMLLQQIATKQLERRAIGWNADRQQLWPVGETASPWHVYTAAREDTKRVGSWRAFQIAFLLMSLEGVRGEQNTDRDTVDLIWFPTGGGKTEAYLGVAAFYMFHQRLLTQRDGDAAGLGRDGTNVLMRYTLRMLTTQQFQRAASLICAMEFLRVHPQKHEHGVVPGTRFSLGLWIGGDGSPNSIDDARAKLSAYRRGTIEGNPLILTECPWCRAEIGRADVRKPNTLRVSEQQWNQRRTVGIADDGDEGPRLHCADGHCAFGGEFNRLPVEVIDERIYRSPTSMVIATADKFAMIAYKPEAGALFGRVRQGDDVVQNRVPPGLIIQDELHLISGPLGTMYALYEGVIETLCSYTQSGHRVVPKIVASTATIRGAAEQVKAVYARVDVDGSTRVQLFPSPGLSMGNSFFGQYARNEAGRLRDGRLYLGIHASEYGSILTTQVRTFAAALFRPWLFAEDRRDPWWTLLAFYNSIRELGGAKTLFDSDIRSRLKFIFNREGFGKERRTLKIVEELTSRLSQADIVKMMDRLNLAVGSSDAGNVLDACLASNIIEVGVDIERLSIMSVVGQPKGTATYIQVTGRVGRKWWERPGLILMLYNPSKSRDRSHYEQFHSYHRRLYERVEPTTATPFAVSSIQRGLQGSLIAWARQRSDAAVTNRAAYETAIDEAFDLLCERCKTVQAPQDLARSLAELERVRGILKTKWGFNPQRWSGFPQKPNEEYLMLWPGQYATGLQRARGVVVPSSMRQVDRSAELSISNAYVAAQLASNP